MTKISSRYQFLILTGAGVQPTVPTPSTLTADDVGWNNTTDIHIGEIAYNRTDNKWYYRDSSGIKLLSQDAAIVAALAGKSDTGHTHDDRYYTETEMDAALNLKANDSAVVKITGAQTVAGDKDLTGQTKANKKTVSEKTADYTFALTDRGGRIVVNTTDDVVLTVPAQATVSWTDDCEIEIYRRGSGAVSFEEAAGVTIESKDDLLDIADQYTSVLLKREAEDEWSLQGNLG